MKKLMIALAAALLVSATARADWFQGNTSSFAAYGGEANVQMYLTADQKLDISLDAVDGGDADAVFSTVINEDRLLLSDLPIRLVTGESGPEAYVSITQFINMGSGKRFYILNTGDVKGLRIISYQKGVFQTVFDGSSLEGTWVKSDIEVTKKNLLLTLAGTEGNRTYDLVFDKKSNVFIAEPHKA